MSLVAIIVDPNDKKVKTEWFYLKKIVISTVQGSQFLYVILQFDYKYSSYCYNISLSILRSPSGFSSYFILPSFFHLYPPRVGQIAEVNPCPISTFLKPLESSCKAKNYCLGITSSLMRPES